MGDDVTTRRDRRLGVFLLDDHEVVRRGMAAMIDAEPDLEVVGQSESAIDRDDPRRVLMRGDEWVFGPQMHYERAGDVPDVVFPCGWLLEDDGDTLHMYYGAADSVIGLATASLADLVDHLASHPCTSTTD